MRCISPMSIPRPNGRGSADRITIPCGKCVSCLSEKRADWAFRLKNELRSATSAFFITITYSEENLPVMRYQDEEPVRLSELSDTFGYSPTLDKRDIQDFMKTLRNRYRKSYERVRYFITGEYGTETKRPHYHGLLFNMPIDYYDARRKETLKEYVQERLGEIWNKGFVSLGSVTEASINYVAKYCVTKQSEYPGIVQPFSLMSRRSGIGSNYLKSSYDYHKLGQRNYVNVNGYKKSMPRYYKEKIFTDLEKERFSSEAVISLQKQEINSFNNEVKKGINPFDLELTKKIRLTEKVKKQIIKQEKL